ncbi:uncharacterized protein MONOS_17029 [Monocercomonoides exilis]|uniref:uncharacterized protein n=1 Tax=Monocercomonoides exilis TaxID=2049356 RepID=UPI0035595B65|nr:hypothetical protein MONOS_17029 [Monocercomonoides exilis]
MHAGVSRSILVIAVAGVVCSMEWSGLREGAGVDLKEGNEGRRNENNIPAPPFPEETNGHWAGFGINKYSVRGGDAGMGGGEGFVERGVFWRKQIENGFGRMTGGRDEGGNGERHDGSLRNGQGTRKQGSAEERSAVEGQMIVKNSSVTLRRLVLISDGSENVIFARDESSVALVGCTFCQKADASAIVLSGSCASLANISQSASNSHSCRAARLFRRNKPGVLQRNFAGFQSALRSFLRSRHLRLHFFLRGLLKASRSQICVSPTFRQIRHANCLDLDVNVNVDVEVGVDAPL